MMNFDDEVLATVRALSATVGVPEHLPAAAAGRARRADILDRGFVPRVLTAFDVARGDATRRPLLRRYVSALMHLAGGGAVECRRLVAMPEFLAFLRTALGDIRNHAPARRVVPVLRGLWWVRRRRTFPRRRRGRGRRRERREPHGRPQRGGGRRLGRRREPLERRRRRRGGLALQDPRPKKKT